MRPDGTTIEQQFAPAFPAMARNERYGLQFTTTNFVLQGATARYRVPPNGALGTTWAAPSFNANSPTNWGTGATGIGFGLLVPGIMVRTVKKNDAVYGTLDSLGGTLDFPAPPP